MLTAAEPIIVTVSHRLGRDEAKRRIENGLGSIRDEIGPYVRSLNYAWDGYRLEFSLSAMMQSVSGAIDVQDDHVRVEFSLPRLLHMVAQRLVGRIRQQASALLEDKTHKS